jgi:hypothetical protein
MPVIFTRRYTRDEIESNPNCLYVFGDNFQRSGRGGQARECRGLPNTVGIPTKRAPSTRDSAYLTDADLDQWLRISAPDFARIAAALAQRTTVIFPSDGIGTGLAQLPMRAPLIWRALRSKLHDLQPDLFEPPAPTTSSTTASDLEAPARPTSAPKTCSPSSKIRCPD